MDIVQKSIIAKFLRWVGYGISVFVGLAFWPQLMRSGFHSQDTNFLAAIIFVWFCIPITLLAVYLVSLIFMNWAEAFEKRIDLLQIKRHIEFAVILGGIATLGSCGMLASGIEPPEPIYSFYNVSGK